MVKILDIKTLIVDQDIKKSLNKDFFFYNLNDRKVFKKIVKKKIKFFSSFINQNVKNKQTPSYWNSMLYFWLMRSVHDLMVFYNFLEKKIKKKNIYRIYKLNFTDNIYFENDIRKDPEKFLIWFSGEYIKFKKIKHVVSEKDKITLLQKKFNKFNSSNILLKKNNIIKNIIIKFYYLISKLILKFYNPRILIDDIGVSFLNHLKINLELKSFPFIIDYSFEPNCLRNNNAREAQKKKIKTKNFKEKFITSCLLEILPKVYFENFDSYYNYHENHLPKNLKFYLTSYLAIPNNKKILVSILKKKFKTKVFVLQHGSLFGFYKKFLGEEHDEMFCDKFLTWGWKKNQIQQQFFCQTFDQKSKYYYKNLNAENNILICSSLMTKYSNTLDSPIKNYKESYFIMLELKKIITFMKEKMKNKIIFRYLANTLNSGFIIDKNFFKKIVSFDEGSTPLKKILNNFKLVIHSDISSTAFLETIFYNAPTLALLNTKEIQHLDLKFKRQILYLKKVGIIHFSSKNMCKFLQKNNNSINEWWNKQDVRCAVKHFKKNYINSTVNFEKELKKRLLVKY